MAEIPDIVLVFVDRDPPEGLTQHGQNVVLSALPNAQGMRFIAQVITKEQAKDPTLLVAVAREKCKAEGIELDGEKTRFVEYGGHDLAGWIVFAHKKIDPVNSLISGMDFTKTYDEKLVVDLLSDSKKVREIAITKVMDMINRKALHSVEEAIFRLAERRDLNFYQPRGGMSMIAPQEAYKSVLDLASENNLLNDPSKTQSFIAKVGFLSDNLMKELANLNSKALLIYQLLGIQMQLSLQVR